MWLWLMPMAAKRIGMFSIPLSASALHSGGRDALDQQLLEQQEEDEDRQQRQDRHGEQRPPIGLAGGVHEPAQSKLDRVIADVVQVDQRREEVVPGPDEGEDRRRG